MDANTITSAIESILFVAERPITVARLKEIFGEQSPPDEELQQMLTSIVERYKQSGFGFEVREAQGGYHFVTKLENAEWVRRFLATKPFRLGRSAMEVLAIIAYRQPVTRADIDHVRGIDSSHLLRTLIERGLVKMAGKAEVPGRPVQYGTTPKFLEVVGLTDLSQLPPLTELDQLQGDTEDPIKTLEKGLDRLMSEAPEAADMVAEDQSGLAEIDTLITSVDGGGKEVFESPEAAQVAEENKAALAAFQEMMKPVRRKKKTVSFEELQAGMVPIEMTSDAPETVN